MHGECEKVKKEKKGESNLENVNIQSNVVVVGRE